MYAVAARAPPGPLAESTDVLSLVSVCDQVEGDRVMVDDVEQPLVELLRRELRAEQTRNAHAHLGALFVG